MIEARWCTTAHDTEPETLYLTPLLTTGKCLSPLLRPKIFNFLFGYFVLLFYFVLFCFILFYFVCRNVAFIMYRLVILRCMEINLCKEK